MDKKEKKPKSKYQKPLSLYPLKPEKALKAFMEVDPEKVEERLKAEEDK